MMTDRLIREYYACFNERRIADAASLFTDDAVLEAPPFTSTDVGGKAYERFADVWLSAFPDARLVIEHVQQRGDTHCEVNLISTDTHSDVLDLGAYGRFKPSGERTAVRMRELLEVRLGRITYSHLSFDVNDLLLQLTNIDYATLMTHLDRIQDLRAELVDAGTDRESRRHLASIIGRELDAARLTLRPWFRR